MSLFAPEGQNAWLCNDPLSATKATRHAVGSLGHTFLAGVPKALSENSAHLHWLGVTASRKG